MKARALAHLGVLADQEAAHAERVDDVALASSRAVEAAHRSGIAEVATAIHVPEGTVRRAWEDARTTAEEHPALWRALLDGHVSERHVRVALEELTTLPVAARGPLEAEILAKAPTVTAASLQAFARRRRELRHPESVGVRHRRARASRHVLIAPPRDGMSTLTAHLPAVAAHAIYNRCTDAAMAVQAPDDPRTLTQLRADAFMAYALADGALLVPGTGAPGHDAPGNSASGHDAPGSALRGRDARMLEAAYVESLGDDDAHATSAACDVDIYGIVPTVAVLVPVDWLTDDAAAHHEPQDSAAGHHEPQDSAAGHHEPPDDTAGTRAPHDKHRSRHDEHRSGNDEHVLPTPVGELVGAGPIDRDTARALVAQSPSLRRILTDPHTGVPLDMSRSTYRIPAYLRAFAQLRDATCRFPSCRRRAEACDLDHVEAWEEGGATSAANLAHLCRMHHRLKHGGSWSVQVVDDTRAATLRDALGTDAGPVEGGPQHGSVLGRLTPSTLRWMSPTGRMSTTHASLDPTPDDTSEQCAAEPSSAKQPSTEQPSAEQRVPEDRSEERAPEGHAPEDSTPDGSTPGGSAPDGSETTGLPADPAASTAPSPPSSDIPY